MAGTDATKPEWSVTPGEPPEFEPFAMTADQQIRAKALECAVRFVCAMPVEEVLKAKVAEPLLWHNCAEFERYIREGK